MFPSEQAPAKENTALDFGVCIESRSVARPAASSRSNVRVKARTNSSSSSASPLSSVPSTVSMAYEMDNVCAMWITCDGRTNLTDGSGTLSNVRLGESEVFVTVMQWQLAKPTKTCPEVMPILQPVGSLLRIKFVPDDSMPTSVWQTTLQVAKGFAITFTGAAVPVDHSAECVADLNARCQKASVQYKKFMRKFRVSDAVEALFPPVMTEYGFLHKGAYVKTPSLSGWPQYNRISYTPQVYFMRALAYACVILEPDVDLILAMHDSPGGVAPPSLFKVLSILTIATLTAMCGSYPMWAELVDDRSPGTAKLQTNRDCDDMAIEFASVFRVMFELDLIHFSDDADVVAAHGNAHARVATILHAHIKTAYTDCVSVICKAIPHVADPHNKADHNAPMCGHVFAMLLTNTGDKCMETGQVVESTRQSSPFREKLPVYTFNGKQIFNRREWTPADEGIGCVKPLVPAQYPVCIAAFSATESFVLASEDNCVGVPLADLLAGTAKAKALPCDAAAAYPRDLVTHHLNYDEVDDAIIRYGWGSCFGVSDESIPLTCNRRLFKEWSITCHPNQLSYEGRCVYVTRCTAYIFGLRDAETGQLTVCAFD